MRRFDPMRWALAVAILFALPCAIRAEGPAPTTAPVPVEVFRATDFPLNLRGATGEQAAWLKAYAVDPATFECTWQMIDDGPRTRVYRLSFPSPYASPFAENNMVPAEYYVPRDAKPASRLPAAVVLDILDGRALLPRMMARKLADNGVAALYIPLPYYNARRPDKSLLLKWLDEQPEQKLVATIRQAVMDVRRAKAVLAARPEVDRTRVGITGFSLGGIVTSLAAGVDGEFYRVVPVLAGGDLPTMAFHAREVRQLRAEMEKRGITPAQLADILASVEPLHFANRIDPKTCLMLNASEDEVIPKACTEALAKAIGSPTLLWVPAGHYSAALFLPNLASRVVDHLRGETVTDLKLWK